MLHMYLLGFNDILLGVRGGLVIFLLCSSKDVQMQRWNNLHEYLHIFQLLSTD